MTIQGNPSLMCLKLPQNINYRAKFWALELVVLPSSIIMYGGIINCIVCKTRNRPVVSTFSFFFTVLEKRGKQTKTKKDNQTERLSYQAERDFYDRLSL